jgi:anion-transporting  ArsA/GET3 family ATPase
MTNDPDDLLPVFDLDLVLVTGKGGVGKSLVAAGLAYEAARMGLRPLLVKPGSSASLEAMFSTLVGTRPTFVGSGVSAMGLDVDEALVEYLEAHLPAPRLARLLAGNSVLRSLFRAAPGVAELVSLDRLAALLEEREPGRPRWRPIIVDLDASGHARMFLDLPQVLDTFVAGGPMEGVVERAREMLGAAGTGVCLVGKASPLAAQETIELYRALVEEHQLLVAGLVVNGVARPPLPGVDPSQIDALEIHARDHDAREILHDVAFARRALARYAHSQDAIARLRKAVDAPCIEVPALEIPLGRAAMARVGPLLSGAGR